MANPNNKQGAFLGPPKMPSCTVKSATGITKPTRRGWTHGNGPGGFGTDQDRNDKNGYPAK